jgi:hypothetical protein
MWAVAVIAAFAVVVGALAFIRGGADGWSAPSVVGIALLAILVLSGLWLLDHLAARDMATERRALDARAFELATRALSPGSALACLDAIAGDALEEACERAVFASPESTAAAVSYVAAQLSLLASGRALARGRERGQEQSTGMLNLRRALEADRFGIVAHVLAVRDGCKSNQCAAFFLLQDPSRVSANLARRPFEARVQSSMAGWLPAGDRPAAGNPPATVPSPAPVAGARVPNNLYFPSSASIPPVNIMTAEPAGPPPKHDTTGIAEPAPPRKPPQGAQQPGAQPARQPPVPGNAPIREPPMQLAPGAQ